MGHYKIRVNVEIVECDEPSTASPQAIRNGLVEFTIGPEQAESIDDCEQALLETNYPALRTAISQHLENLSKKN
jgi:hypothetical protein